MVGHVQRAENHRQILMLHAVLSVLVTLTMMSSVAVAQTPQASAVASEFPRTVTHAAGETTIPEPPLRVAITNENEALDSLLAVGIEPVLFAVGGGYGEGLAPWAIAAGADELPSFVAADIFVPDPERFAAASPDLILGTWLEPDSYEQLSGIAPTVNLTYSEATTWNEVQRLVGEATGREAEAAAAIEETNKVIAGACEELKPFAGTSVAIAYAWSDSFLVNGENAPLGRLLRDCGLEVISPSTDSPGGIAMLSLEQMQQVAEADVLLSLNFDPASIAVQETSPLFRTLPAVQEGHYVLLSPEMAQAFYLESALSLQWAVPQVVDAVEQAAAGDGARLD